MVRRAFTVVEVLVVIAIVGIALAIAPIQFLLYGEPEKEREKKAGNPTVEIFIVDLKGGSATLVDGYTAETDEYADYTLKLGPYDAQRLRDKLNAGLRMYGLDE